MLNLDTHILLFALSGSLSEREQWLLRNNRWSISVIVLWELAKLFQLGRIAVDPCSAEFRSAVSRVRIWPLDADVCCGIRKLDFRGDPADEIIAATSLVHDVPLVTRDRVLRESKKIPLA
jgi:PIN domain nuclease of toxin-antitoxin system